MAEPTCPNCGKAVKAGATQSLPFCSERCKMADLGAWFTDRYRIPGEDAEPRETPEDKPQ